jgi:hypothetical protein
MFTAGGVNRDFVNARRPPAVICHICGRQYGTASIPIHVRTCAKRFEEEEAKKPRAHRRPLPTAPDYEALASMPAAELEAHNEAAFRNYNDAVLQKCGNCGRTFLPDRLLIHQRSCTSANPARRVGDRGVGNGGAPTTYSASVAMDGLASPPRGSGGGGGGGAGALPASAAMASSDAGSRPPSSPGIGRTQANRRGSRGASLPRGVRDRGDAPEAAPAERGHLRPVSPTLPPPSSDAGTRPAPGSAARRPRSPSRSGGGGGEPQSTRAWRASVAEHLAQLATRLAYLQETLLSEVQDLQQEISDLADEVAGYEGGPRRGEGMEDGEEGDGKDGE